jgi:hypothetical protein
MKQLLITIFIISSLAGYSQEKGPYCSIGCYFKHTDETPMGDYLFVSGFFFNPLIVLGGDFHTDSTNLSDSLIYEITLPFGDSLKYRGSWVTDGGPCLILQNPEVLDSVITILEGVSFPITSSGTYYSSGFYDLTQKAVIHNSCFIQIKRPYIPNSIPHFVRVKFLDQVLGIPDTASEFSMWLNSENTLTMKANAGVVWDMNIYSLSGQIIQKYSLEGSQDLDVSNLPKGCYIARVSGENGLEKQLRFIR